MLSNITILYSFFLYSFTYTTTLSYISFSYVFTVRVWFGFGVKENPPF